LPLPIVMIYDQYLVQDAYIWFELCTFVYMNTPVISAQNKPFKINGIKVARSNVPKSGPTELGRRNFYKIVLVKGSAVIRYGGKEIRLDDLSIFFANPLVPYSVEIISEVQTGYSCVFTGEFIRSIERSESFQNSPLLKVTSMPVFKLDTIQYEKIAGIFELMITDGSTDYLYFDDLMRNYLQLIIHEALRLRPSENFIRFNSASLRITKRFYDLLDRQFPVEQFQGPIKLKTAQDFANKLAIHTNYLNRAVKGVTGKSTTALIAERMTSEATGLLQHTDWSINEISHVLGFEYSNYFSNFIKKTTGNIPKFYRVK